MSAVPRGPLLGGSGAAAAMLAASTAWPGGPIAALLVLLALVVLGGAAASVLDEDSAPVVDTAPRTLRWRTAVRLTTLAVPSVVWSGGIVARTWRAPDVKPLALLVAGGGVLLAAVALAAVLRRAGLESPSDLASPVVVVSVLGLGLVHPLSRWVSLVATGAAPGKHLLGWITVMLISCGALIFATRDPYRWRLLH